MEGEKKMAIVILAAIGLAAIGGGVIYNNATSRAQDSRLDAQVAECVAELETSQAVEEFDVALGRLGEDVEAFRALHQRLASRGIRPVAKGREDPLEAVRDEIGEAVSSILFDLRDFFPIEDYPMALYGLEDDLREGRFRPPAGHGRAHLVPQSAFAQTLFRLEPDARATGHAFVAPVNALNEMTDRDGFTPPEAPLDEHLALMAQAVDYYPAFHVHLSNALATPDFERVYLQEARSPCRESILHPDTHG